VSTVLRSGCLILLESSGPVRACNGIALPYLTARIIPPVLHTHSFIYSELCEVLVIDVVKWHWHTAILATCLVHVHVIAICLLILFFQEENYLAILVTLFCWLWGHMCCIVTCFTFTMLIVYVLIHAFCSAMFSKVILLQLHIWSESLWYHLIQECANARCQVAVTFNMYLLCWGI